MPLQLKVGTGYLDIEPNLKTLGPALQKGVGPALTSATLPASKLAGQQGAATFGAAFSGQLKTAFSASNVKTQLASFFTGPLGITTLAVGAVAGLKGIVNAASDLGEAVNKSKVIFGSAADQVERFADGAKNIGLAKAEALSAAAGFGAMAQSAGIAVQASADMSIKLVGLAADMTSFNDQDPSEMLEKLRSGLAGEAEPLRQFGVFLSEARVKQEAWTTGIAESGVALTDSEKILARYNLILADTAKQQGDFARTAGESLPNQLRSLEASFTNLAASVGTSFLPLLTDASKGLNGAMAVAGPALPLLIELGKGFLIFKGLQFLPGLFRGVAVSLAQMKLGAAANAANALSLKVAGSAQQIGLLGAAAAIAGPPIFDMFREAGESVDEFHRKLVVEGESFRLAPGGLAELERQLDAFARTLNPSSWFNIKDAQELAKEALAAYLAVLHEAEAAGISHTDVQLRANEVWDEAAKVLGGAGGNIDGFTLKLRELLGLTVDGTGLTLEYRKALKAAGVELELGAESTFDMELATRRFGEVLGEERGALRSTVDALAARARAFADAAPQLHDFVVATGQDWAQWKADLSGAVKGGKSDILQFIGDTRAAWNQWRGDLAESFNGVAQALQSFSGDMEVSSKDVLSAFTEQLDIMSQYDKDWATLDARVPASADDIMDHISDMGLEGAGVLHALAGANKDEFNDIMSKWTEGGKKSKEIAGEVQNTLVGTLQTLINTIRIAAGLPPLRFPMDADTTAALGAVDAFIAHMKDLGIVVVPGVVKAQFAHGGAFVDEDFGFRTTGMKRDERMAVLQTGEGVLQRRAMQKLGRPMFEALNRAPDSPMARERTLVLEFHGGGLVGDSDILGGPGILGLAGRIATMPDLIEGFSGVAGIKPPTLVWPGIGAPPWGVGTLPARLFKGAVRAAFGAGISFGTLAIRKIAGTNTWSQHSYGGGNADDTFASTGTLDSIANWAFANKGALSLAHLIWKDKVSSYGGPWHPYTGIFHTHVHSDYKPQWGGTPPGHPLDEGGLTEGPWKGFGNVDELHIPLENPRAREAVRDAFRQDGVTVNVHAPNLVSVEARSELARLLAADIRRELHTLQLRRL